MRHASDPIDFCRFRHAFLMWRGRPFDFGQGKLSPAKGADFYRSAVRSRDPQTIAIPSQLYRLRFAFMEEYGKKIDNDFRFGIDLA